MDKLKLKGAFHLEAIRNGEVVWRENITNTIVNVGKNSILDIMFHGATQITTWYIGLIDNSGTKSGTSGTLWAATAFSTSASLVNGDTLRVTYTVSA